VSTTQTIIRGVLFWTPYIMLGEALGQWGPSWWPFPTISDTVQAIVTAYPPEAVLVTLALIALGGHFERGWSVWWFIAALLAVGLVLVLRWTGVLS